MLNGKLWIIALLVGAISIMAIACGGGDDASKEPIVLIEQDWDGNLVTTEVAKIILEREMGFRVEKKFAAADSQAMFQGMEDGDMHFVCCNWYSFSTAFIDDYVDGRATVERIGPSGVNGMSAWYTPTYVIKGDSERGIEAVAPDLVSWEQLNQYKDAFKTADTGSKGRFLDFTPGWDYRNEERVDVLGLEYEVVYSGSEAASFAEIDASYNRGDPILFVLWEPHWAHTKYDLTRVELPPFTSDCWPEGTKHGCGWKADEVQKLAWPGLKDLYPEAYAMLQNFSITNEQQNEMVFAVTQEGKTVNEAAALWINSNKPVWKAWIPKGFKKPTPTPVQSTGGFGGGA